MLAQALHGEITITRGVGGGTQNEGKRADHLHSIIFLSYKNDNYQFAKVIQVIIPENQNLHLWIIQHNGNNMKDHTNMSWLDGALRIIVATIFAAICGLYGWYIGVLAVYPIATGMGGWCPLYEVMGFSTSLGNPEAQAESPAEKTETVHSHKNAA
jgi:aromatic ring-cleaving dioxygenase